MERPRRVWESYGYRMLDALGRQVAALRKRQAVAAFTAGLRRGSYWSIRSDIENFRLADALPCAREETTRLANLPTRLASLDVHTQEQLINWGFASCDAALRAHVDSSVWKPHDFPYRSSALS
jgi:NTE family protein